MCVLGGHTSCCCVGVESPNHRKQHHQYYYFGEAWIVEKPPCLSCCRGDKPAPSKQTGGSIHAHGNASRGSPPLSPRKNDSRAFLHTLSLSPSLLPVLLLHCFPLREERGVDCRKCTGNNTPFLSCCEQRYFLFWCRRVQHAVSAVCS